MIGLKSWLLIFTWNKVLIYFISSVWVWYRTLLISLVSTRRYIWNIFMRIILIIWVLLHQIIHKTIFKYVQKKWDIWVLRKNWISRCIWEKIFISLVTVNKLKVVIWQNFYIPTNLSKMGTLEIPQTNNISSISDYLAIFDMMHSSKWIVGRLEK